MMLGGILNIILDPLFIFGLGLGFSGAAIATATSNLVSTLFFIYIFYRVKKQTTMSLNISYFNTSYLKPVLSVGIASALTTLLANVSNMVIISLASGYGDIPVAAYGIVKRIDMFPLNISFGLCQGIMPLVGSGKKATLLLLPPQRTVRESFPSYGSSFYKVLSFLKTRLNSSKVFLNNKGVLNNYYFQFF